MFIFCVMCQRLTSIALKIHPLQSCKFNPHRSGIIEREMDVEPIEHRIGLQLCIEHPY